MDVTVFTGRINYTNKESYKNFNKNRRYVNILKHHCGNKELEHYITYFPENFIITTRYEHAMKADGTTSHTMTDGITGRYSRKQLETCFIEHVKNIKNWRDKINRFPIKNPPEGKIDIRMNFWKFIADRIENIKKHLQKKNQHVI